MQHHLVPRSLKKIFANADCRKAALELREAAIVGDSNLGAAQPVRAGKLIAFFDKDEDDKHLEFSLMLISPFQKTLNITFAAESNMRAYLELLSDESRTVPTPEDEQATILNLENKARTENVRVLSGDAAWEALATMTTKLENYGDEAWTGFKRPKLFHGSMLVCCMIGSGYYRLVFRYGDPKFLLLTACAPVYQADAVTRALAPLYQKRQACSDCVDKTFTDPWLDKLNVPEGQRKRKYDFIRRALPVYPVTTLVDEKQHLMGQEIREPKRRGRTVSPFHLTLKTYRKVVQQHLRRQCARVQKSALNGVPVKELISHQHIKVSDGRIGGLTFTLGPRRRQRNSNV